MNNSKLIISAYIWNFVSNMVVRGMGVVSTLLLVRLLDNDDFGLIAIAMMVKGFFEVLSSVGVNRYLILKTDCSYDDYCGAWTFNIILRCALAIIFLGLSNYIADFFGNPNLVNVLYAFAIILFLDSLKNIGLIELEKQINFTVKNKIAIIAKVVSFTVTVGLAFYLKSYVALVAGLLANSIASILASYLLCGFRPSLNFKLQKEMLATSSYLFVRSLIGFSRAQADTFVVSTFFGKSATGDVSVTKQFAGMPYSELIAPALSPIFSALSLLKEEKEKFHSKMLQSLFLMFSLIFPAVLGLYLVAYEFTVVVLGEKWLHIHSLIGLFAFMMIPYTLVPIMNILFDAYGHIKKTIYIEGFELFLFLASVYIFPPNSLVEFVSYRLGVSLFILCITLVIGRIYSNFSLVKMAIVLGFLAIPNVGMYFSVNALNADNLILLLMMKVSIGAAAYVGILFAMLYLQIAVIKNRTLHEMIPTQIYNKMNSIRIRN